MEIVCSENGKLVIKELKAEAQGESPLCIEAIAKRLYDECCGWANYRRLAEADAKYDAPAEHEFTHLLMALDDLCTALKKAKLTATESTELAKLVACLKG